MALAYSPSVSREKQGSNPFHSMVYGRRSVCPLGVLGRGCQASPLVCAASALAEDGGALPAAAVDKLQQQQPIFSPQKKGAVVENNDLKRHPQTTVSAAGLGTADNVNRSLVSRPDSAVGAKGSGSILDWFSPRLSRNKVHHQAPDLKKSSGARMEPTLLKKYGVCEKGCIGRGATAVVKLVHNLNNPLHEKLYAVKEFRKRRKDESEKEYVKKLTSEFCISSTLHHPNVVETVDLVVDEQGRWCEVMEYCAGGDLYSVIRANAMNTGGINCCFRQLINGVAYLHSMGVAHRDIKPENLLLDEHGHLKITDFGVSDVFQMCWESRPHFSKGLCGSEPYIAPEMFSGGAYDARKVDIWACGIVYYAMTFHGIPFRMAVSNDAHYANYVECCKRGAYPPFARLEPGCGQLLLHILDPNPETRFSASEIMDYPWFKEIEICEDCKARSSVHCHIATSNGRKQQR